MTIIERFEKEYQEFNGITPRRGREQSLQLTRYAEWLGDTPLLDADHTDLRGYLAFLLEGGLSPNTIRTYRNMIRPFYTWAQGLNMIEGDTMLRLRMVPAPHGATGQSKPRPYTRSEISQFWEDLDRKWPTTTGRSLLLWRNGNSKWVNVWSHAMHLQVNAIAHLALMCGLRRIEIYRLSIDDLHPDNAYIPVLGKNDKEREVPYDSAAREAVQAWLSFRKEMNPRHQSPWLACINPVSRSPMRWDRFRSLLSTIGPGYGLHRLRHTCATERLRAGMPLEMLRRFLGHATLEQTLAYAELVSTDIQKAAERSEPGFHEAIARRSA
jgi:site-specific recombinase XerD